MEQQPPRRLSLTVSAGQAGETVDTLLRRSLGLSGTVIRRVKWLEDGILLDGVRVHTNRRATERTCPSAARQIGRASCRERV